MVSFGRMLLGVATAATMGVGTFFYLYDFDEDNETSSEATEMGIRRNLEDRLDNEIIFKNNLSDSYAVLISGDIRERDKLDLSYTYQVLLEQGFLKENIYILDEDGREKFIYPVDGIASQSYLELLFAYLSKKIDNKDILFISITDHGGKEWGLSTIKVPGPHVDELELKSYLDRIGSEKTIILTDTCYSGGFTKIFSSGNYVGISSSLSDQLAYGDPEDTFTRHFMSAYRNFEDSDFNKDGKVSILEAYVYGRSRDPWTNGSNDKPEDERHTPMILSEFDLNEVYLSNSLQHLNPTL